MGTRYALLLQVIEAWQAKDVEAVIARLHDDIVWHYAAPGLPPVRGKTAARKLLIFAHAELGDRLFLEGVDDYTTGDGKRVATPYAGVLEFQGDLIIGWRDYVDLGVIASQKAGDGLSKHVAELLERADAA
jgi:limonene-1,2-epoxide hydrolase